MISLSKSGFLLLLSVLLFIFSGLILELAYIEHRSYLKAQKQAEIASRNLEQAESYMKACIDNVPFFIGEDVYIPYTQKAQHLTRTSLKGVL